MCDFFRFSRLAFLLYEPTKKKGKIFKNFIEVKISVRVRVKTIPLLTRVCVCAGTVPPGGWQQHKFTGSAAGFTVPFALVRCEGENDTSPD